MRCPTSRSSIILSILLALLTSPLVRGQVFVERAEFGSGSTISLAWADANGSGSLDAAVGNFGGGNRFYRNNGVGFFTEENQFGNFATFAVVWADFDEDGDPDLAVGNGSNAQNDLFINNGDGTFTQRAEFGLDRTNAMAWADCDNDGDLDLAVGNGILGSAGQNRLYRSNGDGTFSVEDQFGAGESVTMAWGDYDNDGDVDLAVGNGGFHAAAQNFLYVNNGDGTFTQQAQFGLGDTASLMWGDADNDGDLDLAVGNWNNGQNELYVNNGDGTFTEQPKFGGRDTNTISWGDYDNDGDLDVAVGNGDFSSADQNYLYINDGNGAFTEVAAFGLGSTNSMTFADVDNDGDLDVAACNEHSPAQNYLYENRSSVGSWLAMELRGAHGTRGRGWSNASGIGAKISVYLAGHAGEPGSLLGYREVAAQGGFASQNGRSAWFGVGSETTVDVIVKWPGSGGRAETQLFAGVAVNQTLTLIESAPLLHPIEPGQVGRVNLLRTSGSQPGDRVYFVWGTLIGTTPVPGCPGLVVNMRFPTIIGASIADSRGEARLTRFIPAGASGRRIRLQAVVHDSCAASNLVGQMFQ